MTPPSVFPPNPEPAAPEPSAAEALTSGGQLNEDVLKALSGPVKSFVQEFIYNDVDPEKTQQYASARRSHLYWEGYQYLYPDIQSGVVVDYQQIPPLNSSTLYGSPADGANRGMYDAVINIIYGDCNKFVAVLGTRAPNPKALALRPDNEEQAQRTRRADRILQALRKLWPVDNIQRQLALFAWKDGTFFLHTPWEVDGQRYGTTQVPIMGSRQIPPPPLWQCVQCGAISDINGERCSSCGSDVMTEVSQEPMTVPVVSGQQHIPNGAPGLYAETIFTTTVPFYSRDLKDAPWLWYEFEVPKGPMIERYPILEDMLDTSDAESDATTGISMQGSITRAIQSTTFGQYYTNKRNRWMYTEIYLKPESYHLFGKKKVTLSPAGEVEIKSVLREVFPRGLKLVMVGKRLVDIQPVPMEDEWGFGKPGVSPYIYCHPVSRALLPIQDMVNEQFNLFRETVERNIPFTLGDPSVIDFQAMRNRPGVPGELIPALPNSGGSLRDALFNGPTAKIEPEVERWVSNVIGLGREITGVLPAIFGGEGPSQTALEATQKRNQAMMGLGLSWAGMCDAWRSAYINGLKHIIRHGAQSLQRFGLDESDIAELGDLLDHDGNLNGFSITIEESIPVTWGALRDAVMFLVQQGPPVWALTGLDNPTNAHRLQDALGMTDWTTPGSSVRDYVLNSVRVLIQGAPELGDDPVTGEPIYQPSIPINDFAVDPPVAITVLREWMLSDEGQRIKDTNPAGWQNVLAWGLAWRRMEFQLATQATMAPPVTGEEPQALSGTSPAPPPNAESQPQTQPNGAPGA